MHYMLLDPTISFHKNAFRVGSILELYLKKISIITNLARTISMTLILNKSMCHLMLDTVDLP